MDMLTGLNRGGSEADNRIIAVDWLSRCQRTQSNFMARLDTLTYGQKSLAPTHILGQAQHNASSQRHTSDGNIIVWMQQDGDFVERKYVPSCTYASGNDGGLFSQFRFMIQAFNLFSDSEQRLISLS